MHLYVIYQFLYTFDHLYLTSTFLGLPKTLLQFKTKYTQSFAI